MRKEWKLYFGNKLSEKSALAALKRLNLLDYFENIVTTEDVGKNKEYPDIYLECAKQLDLKPKECLVYEDILSALKCAGNAGFHVVGVYDEMWENDKQEMQLFADKYIASFKELLDE